MTIAGATVMTEGDLDIDTNNLVIKSLQDTHQSNSETTGGSVGYGSSSKMPSSVGYNQSNSTSDSAMVTQQTMLIGGTSGKGEVNLTADKTTIAGAVVASATINDVGTLTDNGTLNIVTDELIIEDIQDHNTSSTEGFSLDTAVSGTGTTTVGATNLGNNLEQTTLATLGAGNITKKDGTAHDVSGVNSNLNNTQEVTLDQETGGLDATVTVDQRVFSENGQNAIKNNFVDTYEHGEDIAAAVNTIITEDAVGLLNTGETIHNNAMATQLKNDLLRNPDNASIVAGLTSEDPEVYAQAMADLGHLAQNKFGLELSEINLYDASKTDSASLADTRLNDVKGATVVDESNEQYGNILLDAGDGASKTDLANTLGHEVLETQDLQGKDSSLTGGLLGTNSEQTQEALNNAFGSQFANRINQAAGGDLDNTGGPSFSNNLKNSQAVAAGNINANQVGNATVDHRQLYINEAKVIIAAAPAYAAKYGISESEAKKELTQQALKQVDGKWAEQIDENDRARSALDEIAAENPPTKDGYVNGGLVGLFIATEPDYENTYINSNQARMIEAGMAGEEGFLSLYATPNGEIPVELTPMQQISESVTGAVDSALGLGESLIDDYPGTMSNITRAIRDSAKGCAEAGLGCISSDPREGYPSDRAFVDLLQGERESAISNNNNAIAREVLPALPVAGKLASEAIDSVGEAISSAKVAGKIDSGNNGSYDGEADFNGRNPSDSVYQESQMQANYDDLMGQAPPPSVVSGSYTLDNRDADAHLYENTIRSITQTKPAREQGPKGAAIEGSSRFLKGIKNVIEGMTDAE